MSGEAGALNYYNMGPLFRVPDAGVKSGAKSGVFSVTASYNYGSTAAAADVATVGAATAGAADTVTDAETRRIEAPPAERPPFKERLRVLGDVRAAVAVKRVPGISFFAAVGTLIVSFLMVLVVLAQINYNEAASESAGTNAQLRELAEKHRMLELEFERSIDIKEVERFAKDELGMSRPDAAQVILISAEPRDSATAINTEEEHGAQGFGEFVKSLTEYFKRGS